jgi:hypothetical protein
MTWLRVLVSRLMTLFRKGRLEQKLNEEALGPPRRTLREFVAGQ